MHVVPRVFANVECRVAVVFVHRRRGTTASPASCSSRVPVIAPLERRVSLWCLVKKHANAAKTARPANHSHLDCHSATAFFHIKRSPAPSSLFLQSTETRQIRPKFPISLFTLPSNFSTTRIFHNYISSVVYM